MCASHQTDQNVGLEKHRKSLTENFQVCFSNAPWRQVDCCHMSFEFDMEEGLT